MVVVPASVQANATLNVNVAQEFFRRTIGHISADEALPDRILAAFMAVSSLGNIIVMTFTASRGKQPVLRLAVVLTTISKARNRQGVHYPLGPCLRKEPRCLNRKIPGSRQKPGFLRG
jgi:hypothetical protein